MKKNKKDLIIKSFLLSAITIVALIGLFNNKQSNKTVCLANTTEVLTIKREKAPLTYPRSTETTEILTKAITKVFETSREIERLKIIEPGPEWSIRTVTAYNAGDSSQCWGDPCEAADGSNICERLEMGEKLVAANFGNFGDIIEIKNAKDSIIGQYIKIDLTNSRYKNRVDIAFKNTKAGKKAAREFGRQDLYIRLIPKEKMEDILLAKK